VVCQLRPRFCWSRSWTHFHQGRDAIERVFAQAPTGIGRSIRWLPIGVGVTT
jgi:hypothetical protein